MLMSDYKDRLSLVNKKVKQLNPLLYWTDSYKVSHINFEIPGVTKIYSNFTPRFSKYLAKQIGHSYQNNFVVFGLQHFIIKLENQLQQGFFSRPKEEVIAEMKAVMGPYIGNTKYDHFERLHDLGYLPVIIKALPEGTIAPVKTPFFTIENTLDGFEWLPNYLETIISTEIWKPLTVATVGYYYRDLANRYALATIGTIEGTEWQNHDFSLRGQSGVESAGINGAAFLLSSCGTDNIPALHVADAYYDTRNEDDYLLAASVPAGEHSVTTLGILAYQKASEVDLSIVDAEKLYYEYCLNQFETGLFSYVADSFKYFSFLTEVLPSLKATIMARDGKAVIRGDSGDPVHIIAGYRIQEFTVDYAGNNFTSWEDVENSIGLDGDQPEVVKFKDEYKLLDWTDCSEDEIIFKSKFISHVEAIGTIEWLYELFGGTENELGYKVLDSHIGMIYGDGITLNRAKEIFERLGQKGFASTNIVFGAGSYSLSSQISRDSLGMAIKATNAEVEINGVLTSLPIYKDPETDQSKKSAKGYLVVTENEEGNIVTHDNQSRDAMLHTGLLETIYMNGQLHKFTTIKEIRERLWK